MQDSKVDDTIRNTNVKRNLNDYYKSLAKLYVSLCMQIIKKIISKNV